MSPSATVRLLLKTILFLLVLQEMVPPHAAPSPSCPPRCDCFPPPPSSAGRMLTFSRRVCHDFIMFRARFCTMPSIGGTRGVSAASSPPAPPPPNAGYPKGSDEGGVVGTWKEGASGFGACCAAKGRGSTTSPTEDPDVARTAAHDIVWNGGRRACLRIATSKPIFAPVVQIEHVLIRSASAFHRHCLSR